MTSRCQGLFPSRPQAREMTLGTRLLSSTIIYTSELILCSTIFWFTSSVRKYVLPYCSLRSPVSAIYGATFLSLARLFFVWRDFFSLARLFLLRRDFFSSGATFFLFGATFFSLARLFLLWRDFFFLARLFFAGATLFRWRDFFSLARLFFFL